MNRKYFQLYFFLLQPSLTDSPLSSLGLLELRQTCNGDLQRLQGGEVLQGLLSAQGLGGARPGLQAGEQQRQGDRTCSVPRHGHLAPCLTAHYLICSFIVIF